MTAQPITAPPDSGPVANPAPDPITAKWEHGRRGPSRVSWSSTTPRTSCWPSPAPRVHGVADYLQTWRLLEFAPQMLGLVALPLLGLTRDAVHQLVDRPQGVQPVRRGRRSGLPHRGVGRLPRVGRVAVPALHAGSTTGVDLRGAAWTASPAVNVGRWTLSALMGWVLAATVTGGPLAARTRSLFVTYGTAPLLIPWLALDTTLLAVPIALSWLVELHVHRPPRRLDAPGRHWTFANPCETDAHRTLRRTKNETPRRCHISGAGCTTPSCPDQPEGS